MRIIEVNGSSFHLQLEIQYCAYYLLFFYTQQTGRQDTHNYQFCKKLIKTKNKYRLT